jgi:hypothetical protein
VLAVGTIGSFAGSQAGTGAGGATATGATVALVFFPYKSPPNQHHLQDK